MFNCDILCFWLSVSSQAENCTSLLVRHTCCGGNQAWQFLYNRAKTNILQFILRNSVYNLCQYAGVYLCLCACVCERVCLVCHVRVRACVCKHECVS